MKIREIGLKKVICAYPGASVSEVAILMRNNDVGDIPVCENGNIVGIITDRDIVISCIASGKNIDHCRIDDFMSKNLKTVTPDMDIEVATRIMAQEQIRRLPVVEGNKLIGILSLGDIALALENDELLAHALRAISTPKVLSRM